MYIYLRYLINIIYFTFLLFVSLVLYCVLYCYVCVVQGIIIIKQKSYGNSFPEVLLAHACPNDWPIVAKHTDNDELEAV